MIYRRIPTEIDAIEFKATIESVKECYEFIYGKDSIVLKCSMDRMKFHDYADCIIKGGLDIKTLEGKITASVGDFIVKGYTDELGWHFWPVKPSYFNENYEKVTS